MAKSSFWCRIGFHKWEVHPLHSRQRYCLRLGCPVERQNLEFYSNRTQEWVNDPRYGKP